MPSRAVHIGFSLSAALMLSLTACSTRDAATASPAPSASTVPSASPSAAPTSFGPQKLAQKLAPYSTTPAIPVPVLGKDVVRIVGQQRALDVYAKVVEYLRVESFKMERLRPKAKYTVADFSSAERLLSPEEKSAWRKLVRAALAGNKAEVSRLQFHALWNVAVKGYSFAPAGPYVVDEQIGSPVLYMEKESGQLAMSMTYGASLRMVRDGVAYRRPLTKRVTITAYAVGEGFVIDDSYGTLSFGRPLPE